MGGKCYNLCLVALLVWVRTVTSYPSRYNEDEVDIYHNLFSETNPSRYNEDEVDIYHNLFSETNDERSYHGHVDKDDDMTETDEMTDLERQLIARLLDEREKFDVDEEESMNEDFQDPGERGMPDVAAARPKNYFDEPPLSDFETQYKHMANDFSNKDTQFDRGYASEDEANEFDENMMPDFNNLQDFENDEYGRNVNEDLGDNLFAEYRRNGYFDENAFSDFGQEEDERDLERSDDFNVNNDFIEDKDFNGEYIRSSDFESETFPDLNEDINQLNDFDPGYKRTDNIDENPWPADFDEEFLNADNRFLNGDFNEDADINKDYLRAHDINNDINEEDEYARMASEEGNFNNGDIAREEDTFDVREEHGVDGGDGESDDDELGDEDIELLRRLVQNILEKKVDDTGDIDERDLEQSLNNM